MHVLNLIAKCTHEKACTYKQAFTVTSCFFFFSRFKPNLFINPFKKSSNTFFYIANCYLTKVLLNYTKYWFQINKILLRCLFNQKFQNGLFTFNSTTKQKNVINRLEIKRKLQVWALKTNENQYSFDSCFILSIFFFFAISFKLNVNKMVTNWLKSDSNIWYLKSSVKFVLLSCETA